MKKYFNAITIIIISYKSSDQVIKFLKQIPKFFKVLIVDNSNDFKLKKKLKKKKILKFIFIKIMDLEHH